MMPSPAVTIPVADENRGALMAPAPPQVGTPLALRGASEAQQEASDPVDVWLGTADSMFSTEAPQWRRLSIDDASTRSFAHDLAAFRAGPSPAGLQFSRHRTSHSAT